MGIGIGADANGFCFVGLRVIVTEGTEGLCFFGVECMSSRRVSLRLREAMGVVFWLWAESGTWSDKGEEGGEETRGVLVGECADESGGGVLSLRERDDVEVMARVRDPSLASLTLSSLLFLYSLKHFLSLSFSINPP